MVTWVPVYNRPEIEMFDFGAHLSFFLTKSASYLFRNVDSEGLNRLYKPSQPFQYCT